MIIEYNKIYKEQVKDLFCELQEYIESLDEEGYNIVGEEAGRNAGSYINGVVIGKG